MKIGLTRDALLCPKMVCLSEIDQTIATALIEIIEKRFAENGDGDKWRLSSRIISSYRKNRKLM